MWDAAALDGLPPWSGVAAALIALAVLVRAAGHAAAQVILARKGIIMVRGIAPFAPAPAASASAGEGARQPAETRQIERAAPPDAPDHQEILPLDTRRAA
jgi:hypothetical protein